MIPSDSPGPKIGVGANSAELSFTGPSYTAVNSPLAVMQNCATLNGCYGNSGR